MSQRKHAIIVTISAFVLLLIGAVVYSQYYKVVDLHDYTEKSYYLQKFIYYFFAGGVGAGIAFVLLSHLRINRKMILAYILIMLTILIQLLTTQMPFVSMISGRRYIRFLHINLEVSTITLILLLMAFLVIQQKLSIMSKYALFFLNGIGIIFVMLVAIDGDSENTVIAALLFLFVLIRFSNSKLWMKLINSMIYCFLIGGYYIGIMNQNMQNISTWLNPYQDKLGKGYMKVQDFEIIKSASILGKSPYHNTYSGEILPTILILFGWGVFILSLGILIFMLFHMFHMVSGKSGRLTGRIDITIAVYFLMKLLFCILVFFNLLPFFQGGHLPFIGYGSELVIDILLLSIFLNQFKNRAIHNMSENIRTIA
ncbi:MAG: Cell cycle protein [Firmicutes bacterium]|nr:Cell cycle protein [Bacillota bacterium]